MPVHKTSLKITLWETSIGESNVKLKMRNRQRRKMVSTISGFNHCRRAKSGVAKT